MTIVGSCTIDGPVSCQLYLSGSASSSPRQTVKTYFYLTYIFFSQVNQLRTNSHLQWRPQKCPILVEAQIPRFFFCILPSVVNQTFRYLTLIMKVKNKQIYTPPTPQKDHNQEKAFHLLPERTHKQTHTADGPSSNRTRLSELQLSDTHSICYGSAFTELRSLRDLSSLWKSSPGFFNHPLQESQPTESPLAKQGRITPMPKTTTVGLRQSVKDPGPIFLYQHQFK